MIYLYDNAIADDLSRSINPSKANNVVKLAGAEDVTQLLAQIENDKIAFPVICLTRTSDISIDSTRTNFTRLHRGVSAVFDEKEHNVYYERSIPIELSYDITVLTTNAIDMDEVVKELIFKYASMYFLSIDLPYESKRKIRFGISIDSTKITRSSSSAEYLSTGALHQSIMPLTVQGAVMISYTPQHIMRYVDEPDLNLK